MSSPMIFISSLSGDPTQQVETVHMGCSTRGSDENCMCLKELDQVSHVCMQSTVCLTVLAEGVSQVVNGIVNGALAGHPGLDSKAQACQHTQPGIAHLHSQQACT